MNSALASVTIALAAAVLSVPGAHAAYNLAQAWEGQSFFDGWEFYGYYDNLTNGDTTWVNQSVATTDRLSYVDSNGKAIVKVDNTTNVPFNYKRNSVRIMTTNAFPIGSLFLLDALHLPYGCSVWPAFWTMGMNWPLGGEIDIVETVNLMAQNQMAVHAGSGCNKGNDSQQTGMNNSPNCTDGSGCSVLETSPSSVGAAFASAQGGVWATQFDVSGIYIWFWNRANLPANLRNPGSTIDTSGWGIPSAAYPSSSCNISNYFTDQRLLLDITLCGDWAGVPSIYNATCSGGTTGVCYTDNVVGPGSPHYDNAYFQINYIRVYSVNGLVPSGSSPLPHTSTGGKPKPTSDVAGSSNPSNDGVVLRYDPSFPHLFALLFVGAIVILI